MDEKDKIIFYDSECLLCSSFVNFIVSRDKHKKLFFAPLTGELAKKYLANNQKAKSMTTVVFFDKTKNTISYESTALLDILRELPHPLKALYILKIIPRFIRDAIYRVVSKFRHRFFKSNSSCALPNSSKNKSIKIALLNYADVENFGDILFPIILKREIEKRIPNVEVVPISPTGYPVKYINSLRFDSIDLESFDAVLIGGGEVVHKYDGMLCSIYNRIGRNSIKKPTDIVFGIGKVKKPYKAWIGLGVPEPDEDTKFSLEETVPHLDFISLRGELSINRVKNLIDKKTTFLQMPDLGWLFPRLLDGHKPEYVIPFEESYLVVHALPAHTKDEEIELIVDKLKSFSKEHDLRVVLLPLTTCWNDEVTLGKIHLSSNQEFYLVDFKIDVLDKLSILRNATFYLGQSMHGFIGAMSQGCPGSLCYPIKDDKFKELLSSIGYSNLQISNWEESLDVLDKCTEIKRTDLIDVAVKKTNEVDKGLDLFCERIVNNNI